MRSIGFAAAALCLALGSCANVKTAYDAVTTSTVPAKSVYVAVNAFNVVETAATGYITYCTPNPTPVGCNDDVIQNQIVPTMDKGITAKKTLVSFLKEHPGALGDKGLYSGLVTATSTLQTLLAANDKRP
ncbi:hypothetical protein [Rhizobium leguminosarum]|uniref:hypothetical protein n=1 Tax=Rhizobium leguminosarum TaxID=384 RepID=UPI00040C8DDD|nr:hypothetical protein [Rhizobium leguminosarum]